MGDKSKSKLTVKLKRGGQAKHGGYAFLAKVNLPGDRKRIAKYLTAARAGLVQDLGPTEDALTTAQIILIDRVVTKLGIIRCIEEHIRETTVMKGDDLAPSLRASYLAYNNSVRLGLRELGIDTRKSDEALDLGKYVDEHYPDKKKEEEKK